MGPGEHVSGRAGKSLAPEDRGGVKDKVVFGAVVDRGLPVRRICSVLQGHAFCDDFQS